MAGGFACAFGTSLCYGVGTVLQAAAAAEAERTDGFDPRLLLTLVRSWRYPLGLALDAAGFLLSLVALRSLPLYVVQSVASSFLAVTAVVGAVFWRLRLRRIDVGALVVIVLGLTLVGLSTAPESARPAGAGTQWLLLLSALGLLLLALPLGRLSGRAGAPLLGGVGGLAFGVVAVAARSLTASADRGGPLADVHALVSAPASYAVLVATPVALVAYATALQRGTVVGSTAALVVGETVLPALAGLTLLGDHPRTGWGSLAALGFVLAVGGSLLLCRYGEVSAPEPVGLARR